MEGIKVVKVMVRDMQKGNRFLVDGKILVFTDKTHEGSGGAGYTEPYYKIYFNDVLYDTKGMFYDWDQTFEKCECAE
jgi:hypothetical protein